MKKRIQNLPLNCKIQLIVYLCVAAIAVTALLGFHFIATAYRNALYEAVAENVSYSAAAISQKLDQAVNMSLMMLSSSTIQEDLSALKQDPFPQEGKMLRAEIYRTLGNLYFSIEDPSFSSIMLIENDKIIGLHYHSDLQEARKSRLTEAALEGDGAPVWVDDFCSEGALYLVREIQKSQDLSLITLGIAVIQLDIDHIIGHSAARYTGYPASSWKLFRGGRTVTQSSNWDNSSPISPESFVQQNMVQYQHNAALAVRQLIPSTGWDYVCSIPTQSIGNAIGRTKQAWIAGLIFSVCMTVVASGAISRSLTSDFKKLIRKMNLFADGVSQPDSQDYVNRTDEIGQLHHNFDDMAGKVNQLIQENYVSTLLTKEAQLKALEQQMDPHFLYNTLDTIHWRAQRIHAQDICEISLALGHILRYSLGSRNSEYTVGQELAMVNQYMAIQKIRFSQRLDFTVDIPQEFHSVTVPKFTFQPLLENAIRYGLEEISETCHISLSAAVCGQELMIQVKNNGSHFEDDLLDQLNSGNILPHGFGIGLTNIHSRLKLMYGNQYGITLHNWEDEESGEEYAIVTINLPLTKKEDTHAESSDRG